MEQEKIFDEKINEIMAILDYLSEVFGLQYALNFSKQMPDGNHVIHEVCANDSIKVDVLQAYIQTLVQLKNHVQNRIPELINSGEVVVQCLEDDMVPENVGDWIKKGEYYVVDSLHITVGRTWAYALKGKKLNAPYTGYGAWRFKRILLSETEN
jgi:hypothetical protein